MIHYQYLFNNFILIIFEYCSSTQIRLLLKYKLLIKHKKKIFKN